MLAGAIDDMVALLAEEARSAGEESISTSSPPMPGRAATGGMRQVALNLFQNAFHVPEGGLLDIRLPAPRGRFYHHLAVRDSGSASRSANNR